MQIHAHVTFLTAAEGGRQSPLVASDRYRPHIVVGDPDQRRAAVDADGVGTEDYLGVQFVGSGLPMAPGTAYEVPLVLLYYPRVDYSALTIGATFTLREGGRVVGYGEVLTGLHPIPEAG